MQKQLMLDIWKSRGPLFTYSLTLAFSMLFSLWIFPVEFLKGNSNFFKSGDAAQHISGVLFFLKESWGLPLLRINNLNYPEGSAIIFTDSIPLAALLAKLFAEWLPERWHYIGMWHLVAWVGQALAAVFILRILGQRSVVATLSALLFSMTWPILLWRLGHTSLLSHALIIASIALFILGHQQKLSVNASATLFSIINIASLLVHPYFLAMNFSIFLAFIIDRAIQSGKPARLAMPLLISTGSLVASMLLFGYLNGSRTSSTGFGFYALNILSPFCNNETFNCRSDMQDPYESYGYLGGGFITLMVYAIFANGREIIKSIREYWVLTVLLLFFFIYSLSNSVWIGNVQLFHYPLPNIIENLTGTFRASSRFFWPVSYALLFLILTVTLKKQGSKTLLVLVTCAAIQWYDTSDLREKLMMHTHQPYTESAQEQAIIKLMTDVNMIHVIPDYGCMNIDMNYYLTIQRMAAQLGKKLNVGYIARAEANCETLGGYSEIKIPERTLVVMPDYMSNSIPYALRENCTTIESMIFCRNRLPSNIAMPGTPIIGRSFFSAESLPSMTGKIRDGWLTFESHAVDGQALSFGPFLTLQAGLYNFAISYRSNASLSQDSGHWEIIDASGRILANGKFYGTNNTQNEISGTLDIKNRTTRIELKTYSKNPSGFSIKSLAFDLIKNNNQPTE